MPPLGFNQGMNILAGRESGSQAYYKRRIIHAGADVFLGHDGVDHGKSVCFAHAFCLWVHPHGDHPLVQRLQNFRPVLHPPGRHILYGYFPFINAVGQ